MLLIGVMSPDLAQAAPVVDPVADPDALRVRVTSLVDLRATAVKDVDCDSDGCAAWDQRSFWGAEAQLALLSGLGVFVDVGRVRTRVDEADFDAVGLGWGVGARGAMRLAPVWWAAANARIDGGSPGDKGPDAEKSNHLTGTVGLSAVWGDPDGGFTGHVGAQTAFLYDHQVRPLGDDGLGVDLRASRPVSVVGGFTFASKPLGSAWNNAPRAVAHVDVSGGQTMGASAGLGLAW